GPRKKAAKKATAAEDKEAKKAEAEGDEKAKQAENDQQGPAKKANRARAAEDKQEADFRECFAILNSANLVEFFPPTLEEFLESGR
ncbi:unnamed protein product, partial [Symbiodinium sp. CCMP2592]